LVQLVYFPAESRLAKESTRKVMERFLERKFSSDLGVWKGNDPVGELLVEPRPISEEKRLQTGASAIVQSRGKLLVRLPGQPEQELTLESELAMTTDSEVRESRLSLRLDAISLALEINQPAGAASPHFRLLKDRMVLIDSATLTAGKSGTEGFLAMLLGAVGMDASALQQKRAEIESVATEARKGIFTIKDRDFSGYILITSLGLDQKFTLYLSDSGEILKMDFLEYQFVSEDLMPLPEKLIHPKGPKARPLPKRNR
jgi:hypothetical protein